MKINKNSIFTMKWHWQELWLHKHFWSLSFLRFAMMLLVCVCAFAWTHFGSSRCIWRWWDIFGKLRNLNFQAQQHTLLILDNESYLSIDGWVTASTTGKTMRACEAPIVRTRKIVLKNTNTMYESMKASTVTPRIVERLPWITAISISWKSRKV